MLSCNPFFKRIYNNINLEKTILIVRYLSTVILLNVFNLFNFVAYILLIRLLNRTNSFNLIISII